MTNCTCSIKFNLLLTAAARTIKIPVLLSASCAMANAKAFTIDSLLSEPTARPPALLETPTPVQPSSPAQPVSAGPHLLPWALQAQWMELWRKERLQCELCWGAGLLFKTSVLGEDLKLKLYKLHLCASQGCLLDVPYFPQNKLHRRIFDKFWD